MAKCGDTNVSMRLTGSVDMGLSEKHSFPFVQEVVADAKATRHKAKHKKGKHPNRYLPLIVQILLSLLSDSNQRPRDYKSRALAN